MTGTCPDCGTAIADEMERLQVLGGVSEYPSRVKCATLAWHTLNNALDQKQEAARSE
jgi:nitrogen fixation NifU-like protein